MKKNQRRYFFKKRGKLKLEIKFTIHINVKHFSEHFSSTKVLQAAFTWCWWSAHCTLTILPLEWRNIFPAWVERICVCVRLFCWRSLALGCRCGNISMRARGVLTASAISNIRIDRTREMLLVAASLHFARLQGKVSFTEFFCLSSNGHIFFSSKSAVALFVCAAVFSRAWRFSLAKLRGWGAITVIKAADVTEHDKGRGAPTNLFASLLIIICTQWNIWLRHHRRRLCCAARTSN